MTWQIAANHGGKYQYVKTPSLPPGTNVNDARHL